MAFKGRKYAGFRLVFKSLLTEAEPAGMALTPIKRLVLRPVSRKMNAPNPCRIIGLMSGTSGDGVDLACCDFRLHADKWNYHIHAAETITYNTTWRKRLQEAHLLPADALLELHARYGTYLGTLVKQFCRAHKIHNVHAVASHGHTIFHQPARQFTFQLGSGFALHAACGLPVICDFRSLDIALGGEGAPLVPIGDELLFPQYDVCLNIGGIANLSFRYRKKRMAFDICFANMVLNYLAQQTGRPYDRGGRLAGSGVVNKSLFKKLRTFYNKTGRNRPSLGREIFVRYVQPLLDESKISVADKLATCTEAIAETIVRALPEKDRLTVLCTGGGALNTYLMYRLLECGGDRIQFIIPEPEIVHHKEALIFAFLGVLRLRGEMNTLCSVTGARHDSSGGVLIDSGKRNQ
ncbi:MAG: anhydro-N-acetylmuramic acid kinase [Cyclobacteriaceae bacterium]|nr:MAG: anhydro-N-acetylmuramic acid kinase [Cyclobacteriaceae bacterium]